MDRYGNQNNGNPRWHREEQSEEQNTQFGIQNPSNFETNSIGGLQYPHDQGLTSLSQGHIQLFGNPGHQTPVSSAINPNRLDLYHHDPSTHMQATSSNLPIHPSNQTTMNTSWPSSQEFFHNQTFTGQARTQNNHQAISTLPILHGPFYNPPPSNQPNNHNSHTRLDSEFDAPQQTAGVSPSRVDTRNSSEPEEESEREYIDPGTSRPLRDFLPHERVLLQTFYLIRNPTAPTPTFHQAMLWWLDLPTRGYDEWNRFVLSRQSRLEAKDRAEAVKKHVNQLWAIKQKAVAMARSLHRGSEHGKVGRKVGSKNKPKTDAPVKGSRVSKSTNPKKTTAKKRQKQPISEPSDEGKDQVEGASNENFEEKQEYRDGMGSAYGSGLESEDEHN
ncbi:uncharacterized protein K444DRAFT_633016 [Hyaloscypha bicolor E]|uniref:Uncharacterized protein n=1 Tax=Hyaloscypha bicolor E TaxID=1095630 RepID=A0A2J6T0T7_9HELO|nr:uncharacterized protein K444DRAFT_633016 [Hyaloscypha bicolor E]PMD56626.1 hypothetical protein K444DRAFT_633016 [Hyaloscypha bicolor E]